jgi:hypothetical protein
MAVSKESKELLEASLLELFQAERSATRHPRIESERLAATPPGGTMEEIALHADGQLEELTELARERGIAPGPAAQAIGRAFSVLRDNLTDLTTTTEQSYRLTLLGLRHGIDLTRLLRELAVLADDTELRTWSEKWLLRRVEQVERAETDLRWFVENPARAMEPVRTTPLAVFARSALRAFGKMDVSTPSSH